MFQHFLELVALELVVRVSVIVRIKGSLKSISVSAVCTTCALKQAHVSNCVLIAE